MNLVAGSFTVSGLTYNYRTASKTSDAPLTAGSKTYTITTADVAANSSGAVSFSVVVDLTAPAGSSVQTSNGGSTAGKPEAGDTITWTFSEAMEPSSISAGWNGTTTVLVTVSFANNAGACTGNDSVTVTSVNLGTLCLGGNGFVTAARTFTTSSMTLSGGGSIVTIVLGTASGATATQGGTTTMTWTPSASALDVAGNACATTVVTESGAADVEF